MKRLVYFSSVILSLILLSASLVWISTLHGTFGLLKINNIVRYAFIGLVCLDILLLSLFIWQIKFHIKLRLIIPIILLSSMALVISLGGFIYLNRGFSPELSNIPPELILTESSGIFGVPDIAVVTYTEQPVFSSLSVGTVSNIKSVSDNIIQTTINTPVSATDKVASRQHTFMLRDLQPATDYWYRIDGGETYHFTTPDINGSLHFIAGGDAHFGAGDGRPDLTLKMLDYAAAESNGFDYFFSLGDLVELGFDNSCWTTAMRSIAPAVSGIPIGFVPGNHDTLFTGIDGYEYYCSPDKNSNSHLWHRIDVGNVHFIVLDIEWSAESYTEEQAQWLEAQLQSLPENDWKIVLSHGFYYASGSVKIGWNYWDNPETIDKLVPLFEKYGVDMVLSGHAHHMEYLEHSGVTYLISGSLGGKPDKERTYQSPESLWYAPNQPGFMDITLENNQAIVVFRSPDNKELKKIVLSK